MESHEILKKACKFLGNKYVADKMGISNSLMYKWTQPQGELGSGSRNPLDRTCRLMEITEDRNIIEWLCHEAGGFYIDDPEGSATDRILYPAMSEVLREFAQMLAALTKASEDNQINAKEAELIRKHWEHVKSVSEGFVQACEAGQFNNLKKTEK
ncbi:MAG: phage regulatory CII family protein [Verrucomicrobiota bacterium]